MSCSTAGGSFGTPRGSKSGRRTCAELTVGLLAFRRDVSRPIAPSGFQDLAPVCSALAKEGLLAVVEVFERFFEIGSVEGRVERFLPHARNAHDIPGGRIGAMAALITDYRSLPCAHPATRDNGSRQT